MWVVVVLGEDDARARLGDDKGPSEVAKGETHLTQLTVGFRPRIRDERPWVRVMAFFLSAGLPTFH